MSTACNSPYSKQVYSRRCSSTSKQSEINESESDSRANYEFVCSWLEQCLTPQTSPTQFIPENEPVGYSPDNLSFDSPSQFRRANQTLDYSASFDSSSIEEYTSSNNSESGLGTLSSTFQDSCSKMVIKGNCICAKSKKDCKHCPKSVYTSCLWSEKTDFQVTNVEHADSVVYDDDGNLNLEKLEPEDSYLAHRAQTDFWTHRDFEMDLEVKDFWGDHPEATAFIDADWVMFECVASIINKLRAELVKLSHTNEVPLFDINKSCNTMLKDDKILGKMIDKMKRCLYFARNGTLAEEHTIDTILAVGKSCTKLWYGQIHKKTKVWDEVGKQVGQGLLELCNIICDHPANETQRHRFYKLLKVQSTTNSGDLFASNTCKYITINAKNPPNSGDPPIIGKQFEALVVTPSQCDEVNYDRGFYSKDGPFEKLRSTDNMEIATESWTPDVQLLYDNKHPLMNIEAKSEAKVEHRPDLLFNSVRMLSYLPEGYCLFISSSNMTLYKLVGYLDDDYMNCNRICNFSYQTGEYTLDPQSIFAYTGEMIRLLRKLSSVYFRLPEIEPSMLKSLDELKKKCKIYREGRNELGQGAKHARSLAFDHSKYGYNAFKVRHQEAEKRGTKRFHPDNTAKDVNDNETVITTTSKLSSVNNSIEPGKSCYNNSVKDDPRAPAKPGMLRGKKNYILELEKQNRDMKTHPLDGNDLGYLPTRCTQMVTVLNLKEEQAKGDKHTPRNEKALANLPQWFQQLDDTDGMMEPPRTIQRPTYYITHRSQNRLLQYKKLERPTENIWTQTRTPDAGTDGATAHNEVLATGTSNQIFSPSSNSIQQTPFAGNSGGGDMGTVGILHPRNPNTANQTVYDMNAMFQTNNVVNHPTTTPMHIIRTNQLTYVDQGKVPFTQSNAQYQTQLLNVHPGNLPITGMSLNPGHLQYHFAHAMAGNEGTNMTYRTTDDRLNVPHPFARNMGHIQETRVRQELNDNAVKPLESQDYEQENMDIQEPSQQEDVMTASNDDKPDPVNYGVPPSGETFKVVLDMDDTPVSGTEPKNKQNKRTFATGKPMHRYTFRHRRQRDQT